MTILIWRGDLDTVTLCGKTPGEDMNSELRTEAPGEANPADTLTSNFQSPQLEGNSFCCLRAIPVCGTLFWQPEQTNVRVNCQCRKSKHTPQKLTIKQTKPSIHSLLQTQLFHACLLMAAKVRFNASLEPCSLECNTYPRCVISFSKRQQILINAKLL